MMVGYSADELVDLTGMRRVADSAGKWVVSMVALTVVNSVEC
jgi:hypothetical protein